MTIMRKASYALAIPLVTLAATASPAFAAGPPSVVLGGGDLVALPASDEFPGRGGDANVSVATSDDGTGVGVGASVLVECDGLIREAIGYAESEVRADGSFTVTKRRASGKGKERFTSRITVTGRFESPQRASGTVTATTRADGKTCAGKASFVSVAPPALAATPAPAPAGAVLRGIVAGGKPGATPFDVVLRVAPDGAAITRLNATVPYRCNGKAGDEVFYEVGAPVGADGAFRIENSLDRKFANGTDKGKIVIEGRFVAGGVIGTVSANLTFRDKRGKVQSRCTSGKRAFTAVPA